MQQVQDGLDFPIEVISDEELERRYFLVPPSPRKSSTPKVRMSKKAKKKKRQAEKRARRAHA